MADYSITFAHSARKELESLDMTAIERIFPKIETLAKEPRSKGCCGLQGGKKPKKHMHGTMGKRNSYDTTANIQHMPGDVIRHLV